MANSGGWRSPQSSAGTPNNTCEPARLGTKKADRERLGFRDWRWGGTPHQTTIESVTAGVEAVEIGRFENRMELAVGVGEVRM